MEVKKYKLGDIGEIRMCKRILKSQTSANGDIPFYKIGTFGKEADTFINKEIYDTYKELYSFPNKGDILISAAGTIGRCVVYNGEDAYFQDSNIVWIDNNESIVLNDYLFYILNNITWNPSKGSTILRLYNDDIRKKDFFAPNLRYQRKIADTLITIDKKIELNRRINDNLEAMAKQLYDYWFVQFDFPNEEGKPYKSSGGAMVWNEKLHLSIPSNWEAIPLSEIMDYAGGSQPPASEFIEEYRDGYVRFVQIRDYYSNSHITYIPIRKSNKLCAETDIMIARYGASLGRICYGLNGAYNVALAKVSPKVKEYTEYLRIFLMSDGFYNKINSIGQRAAQAGFNKDDIENILIPFPTNNRCIIEFNKKMQPYFFARLQNDKEINTLTKQRDELLPLLMNGQASVNYHLSDD